MSQRQEVLERDKLEETKPYPNYRVVLLNDDENSFQHVEKCLTKHLPHMSVDKARRIVLKVHNEGSAIVWTGPKELAEMYYDLLNSEGLTVRLEPET